MVVGEADEGKAENAGTGAGATDAGAASNATS